MKERKEKMRKGIKKYSPGIGKKSKNKNKGSLQAACEKTRRVSLCSFRAVLTVEAAFVVPLFLLAICTLLGMIDLYRVQALVRTSLHQSAQELGMYASVESGDSGVSTPVGVLSTGICIAYTKSHLPELGDYVSVNLIGSRYENHEIQLKATITYQLPFSILPVSKIQKWETAAWYMPGRGMTPGIRGRPTGEMGTRWFMCRIMRASITHRCTVRIWIFRFIRERKSRWNGREMNMEKNTMPVNGVEETAIWSIIRKKGIVITVRRPAAD